MTNRPHKIKNQYGFMLCKPNGAPWMWGDTKSYIVACWSLCKRRPVAKSIEAQRAEHQELYKDGWFIRPCSIDVFYEDGPGGDAKKAKKAKEEEVSDADEDVSLRRVKFHPQRSTDPEY